MQNDMQIEFSILFLKKRSKRIYNKIMGLPTSADPFLCYPTSICNSNLLFLLFISEDDKLYRQHIHNKK